MAFFIEIDFHASLHDEGPLTLKWELENRFSALMWMKLFKKTLTQKTPISARFTGFPLKRKTMVELSDRLNLAIELINAEKIYLIKERCDGSFSQEFANIIHHHFELLIGEAQAKSEFYHQHSVIGQAAICELNECIHDMEALTRGEESSEAFSGVIVDVHEVEKFKLPDICLDDFSLDIEFGDMALHYNVIGKTWWEVFIDEDEEIFDEAIIPLNVIGGNFDLLFGEQRVEGEELKKFQKFLIEQGKDPSDPKLALGHLRVAKLIEVRKGKTCLDLKEQGEVKEAISLNSFLGEMRLLNEDLLLESASYLNSYATHYGFFGVHDFTIESDDWQINLLHCPVQLIRLTNTSDKELRSQLVSLKGGWKRAHSVALFVTESSSCGVILKASKGEKSGLCLERDLLLRPGEFAYFAYSKDEDYLLEQKKTLGC